MNDLKDSTKFETSSLIDYNLYCHEKTGSLLLGVVYLIESQYSNTLFDHKLLISFLLLLQKTDEIQKFDEKKLDNFPDEIL